MAVHDFPKVYIIGKDHGMSTGLYLNGNLVNSVEKITICLEATKAHKVIIEYRDIQFYWKKGKWNRRLVKKEVVGLLDRISQGVSIPTDKFDELVNVQRRNNNWDKAIEEGRGGFNGTIEHQG
jgi:hypothetical protein